LAFELISMMFVVAIARRTTMRAEFALCIFNEIKSSINSQERKEIY